MRFRLVLLLLVLANTAHADCPIEEAYFGSNTIPLGCKLTVYRYNIVLGPLEVSTQQSGGTANVSGATTQSPIQVPIVWESDPCPGVGGPSSVPFDMFTVELVGVAVGDILTIRNALTTNTNPVVVAAGPCPDPMQPSVVCRSEEPCEDDPPPVGDDPEGDKADHGGCSTTGSGSLFGLLAVVLIWRRARHRCPAPR